MCLAALLPNSCYVRTCFLKTLWLMGERVARLLQHGLLPREEAEELLATLKGLKCVPVSRALGLGFAFMSLRAYPSMHARLLVTLRPERSLLWAAEHARPVQLVLASREAAGLAWRYVLSHVS